MTELIAALLTWAVANSGYQMPAHPPTIAYRDQRFFAAEACPDSAVHCTTRGFYTDGSDTIVLHETHRDLGDVRARAILVHEIVHFLQDRSGKFGEKTCESWVAREHQAYRLQLLYMVHEGANPFSHAMPPLGALGCRDE
jgi:hypothetical protein